MRSLWGARMIPEYIVQHNIGGPWISIPRSTAATIGGSRNGRRPVRCRFMWRTRRADRCCCTSCRPNRPSATSRPQGAIVEHKRLSHVLQVAQALQAQRDDSRIRKAPSRTHRGDSTRTSRNEAEPGKKKQREITQADVEHVILDLARRRQTAKPADKPGRRSAKAGEPTTSTLPVQVPTFDTA